MGTSAASTQGVLGFPWSYPWCGCIPRVNSSRQYKWLHVDSKEGAGFLQHPLPAALPTNPSEQSRAYSAAYHSIIWVGNDLTRSSGPTSCSEQVSYETRAGCSGLRPLWSWKPPRDGGRTASPENLVPLPVNWHETKAISMHLPHGPSRLLLEICQLPMKSLVKTNFQVPVLPSAVSMSTESLRLTVVQGLCSELTVKYPPAYTQKPHILLLFQIPSVHLPFHCTTIMIRINAVTAADSS